MKIEKSEILISTERTLEYEHARAIRGFFGRLFKTVPAFHGHTGTAFIYKHPLIQYKVSNGSALIMGLKEGAYLLKAVPPLEHLTVHGEQLPVVAQTRATELSSLVCAAGHLSMSSSPPGGHLIKTIITRIAPSRMIQPQSISCSPAS